jgi:hypothetical protein
MHEAGQNRQIGGLGGVLLGMLPGGVKRGEFARERFTAIDEV